MLNAIERRSLLQAARARRPRPRTASSFDGRRAAIAIGAALRACRKSRAMTLEHVAKELGSHRPIVGRIEAGRHLPKLPLLAKHMRIVGMSVRSLVVIVDAMESSRKEAA